MKNRNSKGQFIKGCTQPTAKVIKKGQKLALGYRWTKRQKERNLNLFKKGNIPHNKGIRVLTNTGRTHFKKGMIPWNYKGGISKTREYHNFYNKIRDFHKRGALGSFTLDEWERLKAQYNWICPSCKKREPKVKLTKDHIIPISKGGSNNIENIQPLCGSCNSKKYTKIIKFEGGVSPFLKK